MAEIYGPDIDGIALGAEGLKVISPEFSKAKFTDLVESKGYRLAWSRVAVCPCQSADAQTRAPDPNCPICRLIPGFLFFRPEGYNTEAVSAIGDLTEVQKYIIDREDSPSVVIRGVLMSIARNTEAYSQIGDWVFGSFNLTTRPENRVGYYDRVVCLDAIIPYSQIVHVTSSAGPLELRFPAVKVTLVRSVDKTFRPDIDFDLDGQGRLVFKPGKRPAKGTRFTVHYDHHPQFILIEHVNSFRDTVQKQRDPKKRSTPVGNTQTLPIRGVCRLEFLLGQGPST